MLTEPQIASKPLLQGKTQCTQDTEVFSTSNTAIPSNLKRAGQCSRKAKFISTPSFHAIKHFRWQPYLKPIT